MSCSRFELAMKFYPADFDDDHRDEIATTIQDASDDRDPRLGALDTVNLAWAGLRIRMRLLTGRAWYPETREGIALGVRLALFVQGLVAASFLQSAVIAGRSVRSGYAYPAAHRLLLAAFLVPWVLVFFLQLLGKWRLAWLLGVAGSTAAVALLYYKLVFDPYGFGPATLYAILLMLVGLAMVGIGSAMSLGRAQYPIATVVAWFGAAAVYSLQVDGEFFFLTAPLAVGAIAAVLVALGMAFAGKPRGLVAMGLLVIPALIATGYIVTNLQIIAVGALLASALIAVAALIAASSRRYPAQIQADGRAQSSSGVTGGRISPSVTQEQIGPR